MSLFIDIRENIDKAYLLQVFTRFYIYIYNYTVDNIYYTRDIHSIIIINMSEFIRIIEYIINITLYSIH